MFRCVTQYGLVRRYRPFWQICRLLLQGSGDFIFLQNLHICLKGSTCSHHIYYHGTEPYVVTVLFALAGRTANCYHGFVCHGQFIAFLMVRRLQSRNLASDLSISLLSLDSPGKCQDFKIVNPIWRRWRPASFASLPLQCAVTFRQVRPQVVQGAGDAFHDLGVSFWALLDVGRWKHNTWGYIWYSDQLGPIKP